MKKCLGVLMVMCCIMVIGCGGKQLTNAEGAAQFGPLPENYQMLVRQAIPGYLIDPMSAMVDFNSRGLLQAPYAVDTGDNRSGWRVWCWVNARNRMGGYTGDKPWSCIIRNGQVVACFGGR